jgi:predicted Rossmann fold flavoprotein
VGGHQRPPAAGGGVTDWSDGVVVVGGGAAGMLAASAAALQGVPSLLLEKKGRLGTKILISGGGKCNITHAGSMEDIRAKFRPNEGRFLRPSFYRYTNEDFVRLLTDRGMQVYTRPDGRIFPVPPADAGDVVSALEAHLRDLGVRIFRDAPVAEIETSAGAIAGVRLESGERIVTRRLVVGVGGSSYPATGTTGDGWRWLAALGHTIVPLRGALAPIYLDPAPPGDWSGVALRDCVLRARRLGDDGRIGRERMRWRGDLLWTYKGVSGPTALGVSREIAEAIPERSVLEVDLFPDEPFDALNARILAHCRVHPRRAIEDFVDAGVPNRLVRPVFDAAGVDGQTKGAYLGQKERNRLVETLKGWRIGNVRSVPLERGEVVAGGVSLDEVDPRTMRSTKVQGLYLCGEVLDIAGPVGGYNLQAAWSTGAVAGEFSAQDFLAEQRPAVTEADAGRAG